MRTLERQALHQGILPIYLMENAGQKVFEVVKEKFDLLGRRVVIFAGGGNNAGDGFVAARYFAEEVPVTVFFFGNVEKLSDEARENYEKIKDHVPIILIETQTDLQAVHLQANHRHILIDALLGIGMQGEAKDSISFAIDYFNSLNGLKIAVDVPSGMNADTGEGEKVCDVDLIITFHDLKTGLQGIAHKTVIVDIGIPEKGTFPPSLPQDDLS